MEARIRVDEAEINFFGRLQSLIGSPNEEAKLSRNIRSIRGVDAAYSTEGNNVYAAAVLFTDSLPVETSVYTGRFTYPYESGLFFIHEGPFVVAAVKKLEKLPQLVVFDAHGMAHPRLKGLVTICGMGLRVPSIGIAKSKLIGRTSRHRHELQIIEYGGKKVGYLTQRPTRYWSPDYSVSMAELERIILQNGGTCMKALVEALTFAKRAIQVVGMED